MEPFNRVPEKMSFGLFKDIIKKMCLQILCI